MKTDMTVLSTLLRWILFVIFTGGMGLPVNTPVSAQDELAVLTGGLAWSPDGSLLAVGTSDGVWLHRADDLSVIRQVTDLPVVTTLDWSPDGNRVVAGSIGPITDRSSYIDILGFNNQPPTIQIVDVETDKIIHNLQSKNVRSRITSVQWSPDGSHIASASFDCTVRVWDTQSGQILHTIDLSNSGQDAGGDYSVSWDPSGALIAVNEYLRFSIWDSQTGQVVRTWDHDRLAPTAIWSPDGRSIASSQIGEILLWNSISGELLDTIEFEPDVAQPLAWKPDSRQIAFILRVGAKLQVWDIDSGPLIAELSDIFFTDIFFNTHNGITWSLDGNQLASTSDEGRIIIWDADTFKTIAVYEGYQSIVPPEFYDSLATQTTITTRQLGDE